MEIRHERSHRGEPVRISATKQSPSVAIPHQSEIDLYLGGENEFPHQRVPSVLTRNQLLRVLVERLGVDLVIVQLSVHDDPRAVDPEEHGDALHAVNVLLHISAVQQDTLLQLVFVDVLRDLVLRVIPAVDGQDGQAVLRVLFGDST